MEVYLVVGTTGSDDGRRDWVVKAYVSKKLAEKHAAEAEKRGDEIVGKAEESNHLEDSFNHYRFVDDFDRNSIDIEHWHNVMAEEKNEFDPDFYCDEYDRTVCYSVNGPYEVNVEED
jgi:hypothetical protein